MKILSRTKKVKKACAILSACAMVTGLFVPEFGGGRASGSNKGE